MDRLKWLQELCKNNDGIRAPKTPVAIQLANKTYTIASDRHIVAVAVNLPDIEPLSLGAVKEHPSLEKMFNLIATAQSRCVDVGVVDALLMKEILGEPNWTPEELAVIDDGDSLSVLIGDSYYLAPVLSRALAAWTEPTAVVQQVMHFFLLEDGHDDLLILGDPTMLILCAPYATGGDVPDNGTIELPEGVLVLKKG